MFICYKCFIYVHNYSHVSRRHNPLIIQRVAKSTVIKESRKYAPEFTLAHKKWVDFLYGHIIHYLTHHFALWCLFKQTWGCELHGRKKKRSPVSGDNKFTVAVLTVWFLWILTDCPHQLSFIPVLLPAVAQWCKGGGLHFLSEGQGHIQLGAQLIITSELAICTQRCSDCSFPWNDLCLRTEAVYRGQDAGVATRRSENQHTDLFAHLSPNICTQGRADQKMALKCRSSTRSCWHVRQKNTFPLLQLLLIYFFSGRKWDFNKEKHKCLRQLKKFHQKIFLLKTESVRRDVTKI